MADIISLDERLKKQRDKQLSEKKKKRLTSLRLVLQCSNCPRKCAKCGSQLEAPEPRILSPDLPLRLCAGCWEEYLIYRAIHSGHSPPRDWRATRIRPGWRSGNPGWNTRQGSTSTGIQKNSKD